jgi:hypothetical protein
MGGSWSWRERGILAGGRDVVPSNPLKEVKDIFGWGEGQGSGFLRGTKQI